jgi:hypothetical protein
MIAGAAGLVACALPLTVLGQSPAASDTVAPLPVRLVQGGCDAPGDTIEQLADATAAGPASEAEGVVVYLSITESPDAIDALSASGNSILAGGTDQESAIACGPLGPVREGGTSASALVARHDTSHFGTVLLRGSDQGTTIEVIVVSPILPAASPSPGAGGSPDVSPAAEGDAQRSAGASVVPPPHSPLPGTSGAPPFSPLPGPEG